MKKKKSAKTGYQQYEERAEAIAAPIAAQFGIRIYDVEYVKEGEEYYLNVYIDKDGGVTIGDCENVSRLLSDALDKDDPIKDPYTLIVSSPGLGRALTKDRHLQQSIGQDVEIHLYKPHQETGEKDIRGELLEFDEAQIILSADPPVPAKGKGKSRKKKKGAAVSETAQDKAADAESDEMTAAETSAQTETDDKTGDAQNARQRLSVARKEIASIRLAVDFE
jgi:ribosome maturation factor RimP